MKAPDPIRPTDDEARGLSRRLIATAPFAALGVLDDGGAPLVSRIALATDGDGVPLALISDLSNHSRALRADPRASLLVGEPGERGDPLTHPRLTLQARADWADEAERPALTELWLAAHPKAKIYVGLGDFHFVRFRPTGAFLNGGFGKAFRLTAEDLRPAARTES